MSLVEVLAMFAAAFCAGMVNSVAGGGTLITFPVLLAFGLDPKVANATSTVALWPGLIGGVWGYRRELANSRRHLVRLSIPSVVGGVVGAALLIATPTNLFERLIPFLILFATLLFMAQESVNRWLRFHSSTEEAGARWWTIAVGLQFAAAVYGAYFGAGNGIVMLAVLGLLGLSDIHRANGIKMFMALCLNSPAVAGFALSHLVHWPSALLMASGAIAGGYGAAHVARRLSRALVRRVIVGIGLVIGLNMLWRMWN